MAAQTTDVFREITDNIDSFSTIGWLLSRSEEGFYLLTASPAMQREVVSHYTFASIHVKDCAGWKDGYRTPDIQGWMDEAPDVRAYFFLNFQDVLSGPSGEDWRENLRRLDRSRDILAEFGKNLVFCVTPEAEARIIREAMNLDDFARTIRFTDQLPQKNVKAPPIDRSTGVYTEIDWSRPEGELLGLAVALEEQGRELTEKEARYMDALSVFNNQRKIREKILTAEHPDTAMTYNDIGVVYREMANHPMALEWHQRALAIREKTLGPEHPDTATSYDNIGGVYASMGEYAQALEWHQKALVIDEKSLGLEHPDTATDYNNIGSVYDSMGEYAQALEWFQKARVIDEKSLGLEHPETAKDYSNIGNVYSSLGEYAQALEWHQKARVIDEKTLGLEHPATAAIYNNIATTYADMGKHPKALEYFQKALKIYEKVHGPEHPGTARANQNIGVVYFYMCIFPTAEEYYLKALPVYEKVYGTEHPDTAQLYFSLANLYTAWRKPAKAALYMAKVKGNKVLWNRIRNMGKPGKGGGGKSRKKRKK